MFFVFKQKTAYEMRISDWSSDVCSSDLTPGASSRGRLVMATSDLQDLITPLVNAFPNLVFVKDDAHRILLFNDAFCAMLGRPRSELIGKEIGRASCRERVCQYV